MFSIRRKIRRPQVCTVPEADRLDVQPMFSARKNTDAIRLRDIPGIRFASVFAESTNTLRIEPLASLLAEDVVWDSRWARLRIQGKHQAVVWLASRYRGEPPSCGYRAQVVQMPDGTAAVLVLAVRVKQYVLVTFEVENDKIKRVNTHVAFDRSKLRETRYFPPEG